METLPVEMVEMIVRQLTLQDLARCSAVCREWREIFNQDCMWKPHCDPELEEPLRTIPSVATPAFVAPEAEHSTLSPISQWKLAYLREKHLWKNWRSKEMLDKNENVTKFDNKDVRGVDFLTDTLVVVWYSNHFDIFDVSVVPTALMAKTEIADCNVDDNCYCHRVIGSTMLLVESRSFIQVFNAFTNFIVFIKLKHTIPVTRNWVVDTSVAKERLYLCLDDKELKLEIFDLNIGKLLKEESCPVKVTQNITVRFEKIRSSPTSDFVACQIFIQDSSNDQDYYKYYVYSLNQLAFLPGPVAEYEGHYNDFALLGQLLATTDHDTLKVYNFQTQNVVFRHEYPKRPTMFPFNRLEACNPTIFPFKRLEACNDCFVFIDLSNNHINIYFPANKSLSTLREKSMVRAFRIINNKFIEVKHGGNRVSVWKLSGQAVEKSDINVRFGYKTNRSFTKVLNKNYLNGVLTLDVNYLW